jgi:hypothetical protein
MRSSRDPLLPALSLAVRALAGSKPSLRAEKGGVASRLSNRGPEVRAEMMSLRFRVCLTFPDAPAGGVEVVEEMWVKEGEVCDCGAEVGGGAG